MPGTVWVIPRNKVPTRQGERSGHCCIASIAQAADLSVWHSVQGLGIPYCSVLAGEMKANVCARTLMFPSVVSILGMWQATQELPGDPSL